MKTNQYVILLINPETNKASFLANNADIVDICYKNNPKLPGTSEITKAKCYQNIDEAKKDIYLLKYHFRFMLRIKYAIMASDTIITDKVVSIENMKYLLET